MKEESFTFHFETRLPVSLEEAFAWHEKPGSFERLLPPFIQTQFIAGDSSLKEGSQVHFKLLLFKDIGIDCIQEVTHFEKNKSFLRSQIKGPFAAWRHFHNFRRVDQHHTVIEEIVEYRLPVDSVLGYLLNSKIAKRLTRIFNYRQDVMKNDLLFLRRYPKEKLHILMTGSSGLVGRSLVPLLKTMGHLVTPIQRHLSTGEEGIFWDIQNQKIDQELLENYDAVIHLAGENVAQFWTEKKKEMIYKSRIHSTHLLVKTLNRLKNPPKTFICASGIHIYDQEEGFLSKVIQNWEEEAKALHNMRVVYMRTSTVLSFQKGMLKKLLGLFKSGLGAKIGDGKKHMSWISIDDLVYLYAHILMTETLEGPINATSPNPVNQGQFSTALAKVLKRPLFLKAPESLITALAGQMGEELFLSDLKITPKKLLDTGYSFSYPKQDLALKHLLGLL